MAQRNTVRVSQSHSENIPWFFFLALAGDEDAPMTKLLVIFPSTATEAVASVVSTPTMAVVAGDVYRPHTHTPTHIHTHIHIHTHRHTHTHSLTHTLTHTSISHLEDAFFKPTSFIRIWGKKSNQANFCFAIRFHSVTRAMDKLNCYCRTCKCFLLFYFSFLFHRHTYTHSLPHTHRKRETVVVVIHICSMSVDSMTKGCSCGYFFHSRIRRLVPAKVPLTKVLVVVRRRRSGFYWADWCGGGGGGGGDDGSRGRGRLRRAGDGDGDERGWMWRYSFGWVERAEYVIAGCVSLRELFHICFVFWWVTLLLFVSFGPGRDCRLG